MFSVTRIGRQGTQAFAVRVFVQARTQGLRDVVPRDGDAKLIPQILKLLQPRDVIAPSRPALAILDLQIELDQILSEVSPSAHTYTVAQADTVRTKIHSFE